MKNLVQLTTLFCSVLATLSLAAGLNQVATKLDPVSQKARVVSTIDGSELPDLPCIPCSLGRR
ncbi:MAG: hypothetical protein FJ399_02215 [Verrucomicrobia bacterium]|nr:hypothetical protein [Verrucomicrobiota bacterium]